MVLIVERMAQDWAKRLKADPEWNVFEKQARKDKRRLEKFEEKHKKYLIRFYDKHPVAKVDAAVQSLTGALEDFTLKETSVRNFLKTERNLSIKRVTLRSVARMMRNGSRSVFSGCRNGEGRIWIF